MYLSEVRISNWRAYDSAVFRFKTPPQSGNKPVPTCQHATQQLPSFFIYNKWAPLLEYTDVP